MISKLVKVGLIIFLVFGPCKAVAVEKDIPIAQQEALDYLNSIRQAMGLQTVKFNTQLYEAAKNHANYLSANGPLGHVEEKGRTSFTGHSPWERVQAVGGAELLDGGTIWEGIAYGEASIVDGLKTFMPTAYHRVPLIHPDLMEVGAYMENGIVVVNYFVGWESEGGQDTVYPFDGQRNVPLAFDGFENPNPLEQFGLDESGFIISYIPSDSYTRFVEVNVVDHQGDPVSVFEEIGRATWFFYPKKRLNASETYTVTVAYETGYTSEDSSGTALSKTWAFTTEGAAVSSSNDVIYTDFVDGEYWSEDMLWAIEKGYILGDVPKWNEVIERYESRLYPHNVLTEAQFLTVLFRYTDASELNLRHQNDWTAAYQLAAKYNLPTKATLDDMSTVSEGIERGTMAQLLATKHFGQRVTMEEAVAFMYEAGLSAGYGNAKERTIASYGIDKPLKRAHLVTFMRKYDAYLRDEKSE